MCRYDRGGFGSPYKEHFICFTCRKQFKNSDRKALWLSKCPECSGEVHRVGYDFKPPRKEAKKQWKKIEHLVKNERFWFNSCGCDGPGYVAPTLAWHLRDKGSKERFNKRYWENRGWK